MPSVYRLCPNPECELHKRTSIFAPPLQFCPECRTRLEDDPRIFAGRYLIEDKDKDRIGRGGMGEVFRAWDLRLKCHVAIKKLAPHLRAPALAERLIEEAQIAASVKHPAIVVVHDAAAHGEEPYLCMELLDGETLGALLKRKGALPPALVLSLFLPVAEALAQLHQRRPRSIEHRDIKPDNLFVVREGASERLKILDFGISRARGEGARPSTNLSIAFSEFYAPPEQSVPGEKLILGRADVFSLGVTLYEALSGRRPFEVSTRNALDRPPRPLGAGVPRPLADLVGRMLLGDPAARPAMEEVAAVLASLMQPRPQPRWPLAIGASLGVAAVAIAAWVAIRPTDLYERALSTLRAELDRPDAKRRRWALEGLLVSRDRELRHLVQPLQKDADPQVSDLTRDVVARLEGPLEASPEDRKLLERVQQDPEQRRRPEVAAAFLRAVRRLAEADDAAARRVLLDLLDQPLDPPQRRAVLLSLSRSTDPAAQQAAQKGIEKEPDPVARAWLLAEGGDCRGREHLRRASREEHRTVGEQELGARGLAECGTLAEDGRALARFLGLLSDARLRSISSGALLRLATRDRPLEADAARLDLDRLLAASPAELAQRVRALKTLGPQERRDLVSGLRHLGGLRAAPALLELLRDSDVELRLRAARALRAVLRHCAGQKCQELQEGLRTLLQDRDRGVRVAAAYAFPMDPDSARTISEGLDDSNPRVREVAVAATPAEDPALLRAIADPDEEVRFRAAERLAGGGAGRGEHGGTRQAAALLLGALSRGNAEKTLRAYAALRKLGREPPLPAALQGPWYRKDLALRFLVVSTAAYMPAEEALRYLRQAVRDRAAAVRRLVAEVAFLFLKEQQVEAARPILLVLRGDGDMTVRRRVLAMLAELAEEIDVAAAPPTTETPALVPAPKAETPAAALLREVERAREQGDLGRAQELLQQAGALLEQQPRLRGRWLCLRGQVAEAEALRGDAQKHLILALSHYERVLQLPREQRHHDDVKQAAQRRDQIRTRMGQVRVAICCPGQPERVEYLAPRQYTLMICGVRRDVAIKPGGPLRLGTCPGP